MLKKSAKYSRISAGVDRVCTECDKEFYVGITIDNYLYKIKKGGNIIKYQCGYSCWKIASAKVSDKRYSREKKVSE